MESREGLVRRGINNIYTVLFPEGERLCRIKGKQLPGIVNEYNPIAVGDIVVCSSDDLIISRKERSSWFSRWNIKGLSNQVVAANMDQVVIVASTDLPPFRPRFVDRAIACVHHCPVILVMNKIDMPLSEDFQKRFDLYGNLGYAVVSTCAESGVGKERLLSLLAGKTTAFVGQSGVGKSSLINMLTGSSQKTGEVSEKWSRGCHTTNHAISIQCGDFTLIDTPGVRELFPPHGELHAIMESFPEFREPSMHCQYDGCLHENEPGCRVKELVESGEIDQDRYESYLRMLEGEREMTPSWVQIEKKMPKKGRKYKDDHGDTE